MITKDLGAVSAYAYAVEKGYTGTEAEYAELMASYASVAQQASQGAQTATEKAQQASASATSAIQSADTASASAQTAQTAQQAASTKASEAQQSAQTASTKAQEASQSASESSQSASTAVQAKQDAQTAKTASETAQGLAETAQGLAEDARDLAQQYAESIDPEHIFSAYPTDTASGAVASFADGADDIPLKSLVVNIDPVQSGSGDPSPDNVRPITGWTGVNVKRMGVNLWDEEWESGTLDIFTGKKVNSNVTMRSKNFIPVKPRMKYIAVGPHNVVNTNQFIICYYDKDEVYVGYRTLTRPGSFEVPSDGRIALMRFAYRYYLNDSGDVYNHDVSVNYPSTATAYAPYSSTTYSITFPSEAGTVYGGELDVTNGVLTVDMAMVDLGTLTWEYSSPRFSANVARMPNKAGRTIQMVCSAFLCLTHGEPYDQSSDFVAYGAFEKLYIHDSQYTDASTFKSAMDGVMLCYELAEPITLALTPIEIKSLLGDNNLWADTGDSTVTYRADTTLYINRKIAEAVSALS